MEIKQNLERLDLLEKNLALSTASFDEKLATITEALTLLQQLQSWLQAEASVEVITLE